MIAHCGLSHIESNEAGPPGRSRHLSPSTLSDDPRKIADSAEIALAPAVTPDRRASAATPPERGNRHRPAPRARRRGAAAHVPDDGAPPSRGRRRRSRRRPRRTAVRPPSRRGSASSSAGRSAIRRGPCAGSSLGSSGWEAVPRVSGRSVSYVRYGCGEPNGMSGPSTSRNSSGRRAEPAMAEP